MAKNYDKAIEQLKERFGRTDLLVQVYVRDLLSLVMKNAISGRSKTDLPALYDELEGKIRALESLGRTQSNYGDFLMPLVESSLPETVLIAYERSRSSDQGERSLQKLMNFLQQEVKGEELVVLARAGFGTSTKMKEPVAEKMDLSTTAALVSTTHVNTGKINFICLFCGKKHLSQDCYFARKLSLEERRKVIYNKKACVSCLKLGHTARTCRMKIRCIICNKNHFILMCPDREMKNNEPKTEEVSSLANSSAPDYDFKTVFLMTLIVKVKNKKSECNIRAILDTGS
ncbi:uncharacterized protein [Parasteatoda tepidariorum]|uniref:uncharacterized protein n=1 Tax=Parasteatoda tepidariorum TaxID=114398 RepID=UPI0039BD5E0A